MGYIRLLGLGLSSGGHSQSIPSRRHGLAVPKPLPSGRPFAADHGHWQFPASSCEGGLRGELSFLRPPGKEYRDQFPLNTCYWSSRCLQSVCFPVEKSKVTRLAEKPK